MIAPDELSRKVKTVSGDTAAAMTQRNPTMLDESIAIVGTPRLFTVIRLTGASRRAANTNNIRDAVYIPEFRQDSTAVSTTAFMIWSAYGMPITVNALTYGEDPSSFEFHGRMTASRKTEPTKKMPIRTITELVALAIALAGSFDSAAAIGSISAPAIEKIPPTMLVKTAPMPFGKNPPLLVRFEKSKLLSGQMPSTYNDPNAMKTTIAATLMPANQNSNSPNELTENRFVAVIKIIRISDSNHSGASNQ